MINDKNIKPDTLTEGSPSSVSAPDLAQLQAQIRDMQMEIDILKETINVLKKDPGHRSGSSQKQGEGSDDRCSEE